MKLATAPTSARSFDSAATSVERSKSCCWTETFISASGHGREEGDLVPCLDRGARLHHLLVHRGPHRPLCGEHGVPVAAARLQVGAQGFHRRNALRELELLGLAPEPLAHACE